MPESLPPRLYKAGTGSSVEEDHARTEETQEINAAEEVEAAEEEGLLCGERRRSVETTQGSEEIVRRRRRRPSARVGAAENDAVGDPVDDVSVTDRSASVCEVRSDVASTWPCVRTDSAFSKGAISTCVLHVSAMSAPHHKRNFRSIAPSQKALLNELMWR
ncbi:hypothetical protein Scep_015335 [Stephania cephalantha]|uniref:Uncharacterized protein n=1 Tax=Stephania cephalantha TaxID=152367 RepID=A0AAP0P1D2_9MAGN